MENFGRGGGEGVPHGPGRTYKVGLVVGSKQVAHERAAVSCDDRHLLWIARVSIISELEREVLGVRRTYYSSSC